MGSTASSACSLSWSVSLTPARPAGSACHWRGHHVCSSCITQALEQAQVCNRRCGGPTSALRRKCTAPSTMHSGALHRCQQGCLAWPVCGTGVCLHSTAGFGWLLRCSITIARGRHAGWCMAKPTSGQMGDIADAGCRGCIGSSSPVLPAHAARCCPNETSCCFCTNIICSTRIQSSFRSNHW